MFRKAVPLFALFLLASPAQAYRLGISYDIGDVRDKGFNQAAYSGAERARKELKVDISAVSPDPKTKQFRIDDLARAGADLIIGVGFSQTDVINNSAKRFPKQHFAIIDGEASAPNVTAITFRENEASYLAGLAAGMNTSTNVIGFIGGMDVPVISHFRAGFEAGIKAANPRARLIVSSTSAPRGKRGTAPPRRSNWPKACGLREPTSSSPLPVAPAPDWSGASRKIHA